MTNHQVLAVLAIVLLLVIWGVYRWLRHEWTKPFVDRSDDSAVPLDHPMWHTDDRDPGGPR